MIEVLLADIDEGKQAEQRLKAQEAELLQMLDFTPVCIGVVGADGRPFYANRASLDYLGMSLDEWRQKGPLGDEAHPEDLARPMGESTRASSTGSGFELELRLRTGDAGFSRLLSRFNPMPE